LQNPLFKLRFVMKMTTSRRTTSTLYAAGLAAALAITGCGGGGRAEQATAPPSQATTSEATGASATSPSTTASPASTTAAGPSLTVTVTGRKVTPAPATIDLAVGQTLTVTITSDHHDELHAHGFEVEEELKAGVRTTVRLKGTEPGVYEVETHHPELRLFQVAVR
jgi:plastocyanin